MTMDEPFADGHTWLHRLDSRAKLIAAFAFALVIALAESSAVLGAALAFAVLLTILSRPPLRALAIRLASLNMFIAALWLLLPLTGGGDSLPTGGPFAIQTDGLRLAWLITLKANAVLLLLTSLIATSSIFNLAHALSHLHVPQKMVQLFFFTWRFLHDIAHEYRRLRRAMRVRGFRPRSNLPTYRGYAYLVGTLLVSGHDRAERVYDAMVLRGFTGILPAYHHPHWRRADAAALAVFLAVAATMGALEWTTLP